MRLRQPPRIKVLEAAGAIADGRVHLQGGLQPGMAVARVTSSEGDREYRVAVVVEGSRVRAYSDDNGTKFRGYVGYPIISLLMLMGVLPRDQRVEEALKGIDWRRLNETYKKYAVVEGIVLKQASSRAPPAQVEAFRDKVMGALRTLDVELDESLAQA